VIANTRRKYARRGNVSRRLKTMNVKLFTKIASPTPREISARSNFEYKTENAYGSEYRKE
jgi:hypothetical protein